MKVLKQILSEPWTKYSFKKFKRNLKKVYGVKDDDKSTGVNNTNAVSARSNTGSISLSPRRTVPEDATPVQYEIMLNLALLDKFCQSMFHNHLLIHDLRQSQKYDKTDIFKSINALEREGLKEEDEEKDNWNHKQFGDQNNKTQIRNHNKRL